MNSNTDLLYNAYTIEEMREAIRLNPDVNIVCPKHDNMVPLEHLLCNTYRFLERDGFTSSETYEGMIELLLQAGAKYDHALHQIEFKDFTDEAKIRLLRLFMNYGFDFKTHLVNIEYFTIVDEPVKEFITRGYRMEKIRDTFCASMIQNWFLKKYYDPYHPYGKKRLEREFSQIEKELLKNR